MDNARFMRSFSMFRGHHTFGNAGKNNKKKEIFDTSTADAFRRVRTEFELKFADTYIDESKMRVEMEECEARAFEKLERLQEEHFRKLKMHEDWMYRQWVGLNGTAPMSQILRVRQQLEEARHRVHANQILRNTIRLAEKQERCREQKMETQALLNNNRKKEDTLRSTHREHVEESQRRRKERLNDTSRLQAQMDTASSVRELRKEWSKKRVEQKIGDKTARRQNVLDVKAELNGGIVLRPSRFLPPVKLEAAQNKTYSMQGGNEGRLQNNQEDMAIGCDTAEIEMFDEWVFDETPTAADTTTNMEGCTSSLPPLVSKTKPSHKSKDSTKIQQRGASPQLSTMSTLDDDEVQLELNDIQARYEAALCLVDQGYHSEAFTQLAGLEHRLVDLHYCDSKACLLHCEITQHCAITAGALHDVPTASSYITKSLTLLKTDHNNHGPLVNDETGKHVLLGSLHTLSLIQLLGTSPERAVFTHQEVLALGKKLHAPMNIIIQDFKNCLGRKM